MTTDTNGLSLLTLPRRVRAFAVLAAAALATAAVTAGYALAQSRSYPIGTGVVVIETNLAYQATRAAGTGMVLTSSGEILTNNHVIRGATTIKVVVPKTGHSYAAKVVGYNRTDDVAVLQAAGASNLKTVALGNSAGLTVGQLVKAVGNALGGGSLVKATGQITGLSRTITVNDDTGGTATLRNLIETSTNLQPGDSGGPLFNTAGKVIGMDSAATTSGAYQDISTTDGYAIPINRALAIAKQIVSGKASATVHIGATAFLGISTAPKQYDSGQQGAVVATVVPGSGADTAGLETGDLITAIDGTKITSSAAVSRIIMSKKPGATLTVAYVDSTGTNRTVRIKLGTGPPQ
jgi:S1-C subfamily serine protease